jgi:tetratricopeptide (TPR) repeat protein
MLPLGDAPPKTKQLVQDIGLLSKAVSEWRFDVCEESLRKIRKEYALLRHGLTGQLEVGSILRKLIDEADCNDHDVDCLRQIAIGTEAKTRFCLDSLNRTVSEKLQHIDRSFLRERGKCLYSQGRLGEALDIWERILKTEPDNEFIHSKLDEVIEHLSKAK